MREDFSRSLPHFFDQAPPARYSSAMWTAMAPSATAVTTWRSGFVRTSPTEIGPCGFVRRHIAAGIQLQLAFHQLRGRLSADADEEPVAGKDGFRPGLHIPQPDAGQLLFVQQLRNSAVPAEFHVLCLYQWLVVDLRGQIGRAHV